MTSTNASPFTPLSIGKTDAGDFSSWLGRPIQIGSENYTVMQCGVAIASGSNGKQLVTVFSGGIATWVATLCTGVADPYNCGMIPFTLTGPIVSGTYFLALTRSDAAVGLVHPVVSGGTGGVATGTILVTGTGADLVVAYTGATTDTFTGATLANVITFMNSSSVSLESNTGTSAVSGAIMYRAPFRGA